jgi:hypothetical protein
MLKVCAILLNYLSQVFDTSKLPFTVMTDGAVLMQMTDQLGTPREGVMSTAASLPSVMKPRFIEPVGERTKLQKVMLASFVTLRIMAPEILLVYLHLAAM